MFELAKPIKVSTPTIERIENYEDVLSIKMKLKVYNYSILKYIIANPNTLEFVKIKNMLYCTFSNL